MSTQWSMERLERGAPRVVEVDPGLRFECAGCTACCTHRYRVPLPPGDEARITAFAEEEGWPLESLLSDPDEEGVRYLRHREGRCVFLEADGRCELHRRWGVEAKPQACRSFPLETLTTPGGGVLLRENLECSGGHRAARGALLAPRAASLITALEGAAERVPALPERVLLGAEKTVSFAEYRALERRWIELQEETSDWRATTTAICASLGLQPGWETLRATLEAARATVMTPAHWARLTPGGEPDLRVLLVLIEAAEVEVEPAPSGDIEEILSRYLRGFLRGRFFFDAPTIEVGAVLLWLITRLTASFSAAIHHLWEVGEGGALAQEAQIFWHLFLIKDPKTRESVLPVLEKKIENISGESASWV